MAATSRKVSPTNSARKADAKLATAPSSQRVDAIKSTAFSLKPRPTLKAKLVKSKLAYKGKVFNVYTDTVIEPGGRQNIRDVIHHNGSVVILAVDDRTNPVDPDVILIRQYRHAAGQFLIELPAGRIDLGEKPLAAAKREMIEETGFRAKKWTLLTKYFASPGFLGEWMQIYLAQDLREGMATPEEDEHIESHRVPLSEAMTLVAANQIHDGKTLIGLSLYEAGLRQGRFAPIS